MEGLTEGRIVHFVMPNGEHRPAIVVRVWRVKIQTDNEFTLEAPENGCCQLQVFTDGSNDVDQSFGDNMEYSVYKMEEARDGIMWRTSVLYSENPKPSTWHWVEKA